MQCQVTIVPKVLCVFVIFLDTCGDSCLPFQENYFSWDGLGVGRSTVFLFIQMVVFWAIIAIIETGIAVKLFYMCRPKVVVSAES